MKKYLILMVIKKLAFPFIYYDTGWTENFDPKIDPSFVCVNGYSWSATIPFSDIFQNIPWIFFTYEKLDNYNMFYLMYAINSIYNTN